jgi:type IV pilus assembly protein PilM
MLFSKNAVGMEITGSGLTLVKISGAKPVPVLQDCIEMPLPETLRISLKDPNVISPDAFISAVREGHNRLLAGSRRVAVSLPDSVGRIVILDLETRFKSRDEGTDLIRWKLKKSFPYDISDSHIDYQILQTKETGEVSVLIGIIAKPIICQYEELISAAGLEPNRIEFTSFSVQKVFSDRLDLEDQAAYIAWYRETVSIFIFNNGVLEFFRSKEFHDSTLDINRIFREINSSLLVYANRKSGQQLQKVFFTSLPTVSEALRSVISEATGFEPFYLDHSKLAGKRDGLVNNRDGGLLLAAVGAAMGNL